jgi:translation initiation factor IF-1
MAKQQPIETEGVITEALGNSIFRAQLNNGHIITTHLSGKIRLHSIQILPGDKVTIEMSPYDLQKGRIIRRLNPNKKSE